MKQETRPHYTNEPDPPEPKRPPYTLEAWYIGRAKEKERRKKREG